MTALHSRIVARQLSGLDAEHYGSVIDRAEGRRVALNYLAAVAGAMASAVASLDERICPIDKERERSRRDCRWHSFRAHTDRAARIAYELDQRLRGAAELAPSVLARGETVVYQGSLTAAHGEYVLDGPCVCDNCLDVDGALMLTRPGSHDALTCVNPQSITAAPRGPYAGLEVAGYIEPVLTAAIEALPDLIEPEYAVTLVRELRTLAGRAGDMFTTWQQPFRDRLDRFVAGPHGDRVRRHRNTIISAVDSAGMRGVQAGLYQAIRVLTEIGENPAAGPVRDVA